MSIPKKTKAPPPRFKSPCFFLPNLKVDLKYLNAVLDLFNSGFGFSLPQNVGHLFFGKFRSFHHFFFFFKMG